MQFGQISSRERETAKTKWNSIPPDKSLSRLGAKLENWMKQFFSLFLRGRR